MILALLLVEYNSMGWCWNGFHDYVTYNEKFEEFSNRVMKEANKIQDVKGIQFTENYAVIIYEE